MSKLHSILVLLPALLASACETVKDQSGGQVGEETHPVCRVVETTTLGLDEDSPLGFSAADVLPAAGREDEEPLLWATGDSTTVSLRVTHGEGGVEFQSRELNDDVDGGILEGVPEDCPDVIAISMELDIASGDDAIDDVFELISISESPEEFILSVDITESSGSLDLIEFAPPSDWDAVTALLILTFSGESAHGDISGTAERTMGSGNDSITLAEFFEVAVIGEPPDDST